MMVGVIAFVLAALFAAPVFAAELNCTVVSVHDGDTLTCLTDEKKQIKVRLAEIDAPEMPMKGKPAQPYGPFALDALTQMVMGKQVRIVTQEVPDRYGREIGTVWLDNEDINAAMVEYGHAWAYEEYLRPRSKALRRVQLMGLQEQAKAKGNERGVWAIKPEPIAPWEWRHRDDKDANVTPVPRPVVSCEVKRYCNQIRSCEEARSYLSTCPNMAHLDGDRDGTPCANLCR